MLLYCDNISPRLQYIVDFFSEQLFAEPIVLTTDAETFRTHSGPKINYSDRDFSEKEFYIRPVRLLFETDIRKQSIDVFELNFHKAFFGTKSDLSFDIFAASFYLLSRYEEYLPHEKDEYGRYAHMQSLAHREHFLQEPLINIWIEDFKRTLQRKFPDLLFRHNQFKCLLTYDIDIAWSFKHKGWIRSVGGAVRDAAGGNWSLFKDRWQVLTGKLRDPFDCFEWLDALHLYCRIKPYYFFLVAKHTGRYDKNTATGVKAFRDLIEYYANTYKVGIHPSWQSGDDHSLLKEEVEWMEVVTDKPVTMSRQHYIRLNLPVTYRRLISAGIQKDFSMGYGSINGFRASVCSSFLWFDLEKNESTPLRVYPFCFMDANSFYEQKFNTAQAYTELMQYYNDVKKYNGIFIPIWHNNILGTDPRFAGWREMFELFMKETVYWDAYYDEA
jgi:hypothetical protein